MISECYMFSYKMSNLFMENIHELNSFKKMYIEISGIGLNLIDGYFEHGYVKDYSYNELGYCILELNKIYIPFVVGGNFRKDYINVQSLLVHELTHIYHFQKYNHREPYHDNYDSYFASLYENECMINEIKFRLGSQTLDEIFADNKNLKIVFDKNNKRDFQK